MGDIGLAPHKQDTTFVEQERYVEKDPDKKIYIIVDLTFVRWYKCVPFIFIKCVEFFSG